MSKTIKNIKYPLFKSQLGIPRDSKKGTIGALGIPMDFKKGSIGTLGALAGFQIAAMF